MPLDASGQSLERLAVTPGVRAVYSFESGALSAVQDGDAEDRALAEKILVLWSVASRFVGADFLMLRLAEAQAVASARAGLIVLGEKNLNAGLLRQQIKSFAPVSCPDVTLPQVQGWNAGQKAIWALAERLGRIEAPRTFELMLGDYEYVIEADREGFSIIDETGGAQSFVDRVHQAVTEKQSIEFTFGEPRKTEAASRHGIAELFGASKDAHWRLGPDGWPAAVPTGSGWAAVRDASWIGRALDHVDSDRVRADLLDDAGRKICSEFFLGEERVLEWVCR